MDKFKKDETIHDVHKQRSENPSTLTNIYLEKVIIQTYMTNQRTNIHRALCELELLNSSVDPVLKRFSWRSYTVKLLKNRNH